MDRTVLDTAARIRAGVDYRELQIETHRLTAGVLVDAGLASGSTEALISEGVTTAFMPHGIGHLLGLQVHDVAGHIADDAGTPAPPPVNHAWLRLNREMRDGMVFTIEPGGWSPHHSHPYEHLTYCIAGRGTIVAPDGEVIFEQDAVEAPAAWSPVAVDILAQKYLRRTGVPARAKPVSEKGVPAWLQRRRADETALAELADRERFGGETSAKQVFDRMAGAWTYWGWKGGYFDDEEAARVYMDEMRAMLALQIGAAGFHSLILGAQADGQALLEDKARAEPTGTGPAHGKVVGCPMDSQ